MDAKCEEAGKCIFTGKSSSQKSVICKSILIFLKKVAQGVATFKNSCIFASAMNNCMFI